MTEYKVFNIRCRSCLREGQLTIESDGSTHWDYVMTGFSGAVYQDGPDLSTLECFRCFARTAMLISGDDGIFRGRVN